MNADSINHSFLQLSNYNLATFVQDCESSSYLLTAEEEFKLLNTTKIIIAVGPDSLRHDALVLTDALTSLVKASIILSIPDC